MVVDVYFVFVGVYGLSNLGFERFFWVMWVLEVEVGEKFGFWVFFFYDNKLKFYEVLVFVFLFLESLVVLMIDYFR